MKDLLEADLRTEGARRVTAAFITHTKAMRPVAETTGLWRALKIAYLRNQHPEEAALGSLVLRLAELEQRVRSLEAGAGIEPRDAYNDVEAPEEGS